MKLEKYIDHTFLKPDGSPADIARLCREARKFGFASVCVHPCEVARCARLLAGSGVKVCTVVGFPLGQNSPKTVEFEARQAVADGADELDFVVNVSRLKVAARRGAASREAKAMADDFRRALAAAKEAKSGVLSKLIIECCYLTDAEKVFACRLAKASGFDFVKTSTGFGTGGATVADVKLMRRTVGAKTGVKAAGGIRTKADALAMVAAGATRLGCSCSTRIIES